MTRSTSFRQRSHLLASVGTALAAMLAAAPVSAQNAPASATGDRAATNTQTSNVLTLATGEGTRTTIIGGPTDASSVTLDGNTTRAIARGNDAALTVMPDPLSTGQMRDTLLGIDPTNVTGTANLVIANRQELRSGGSVQSDQFSDPYRITLGSVARSSVALDANRSDSASRGNAVVNTIDGSTSLGARGAGIVSAQVAAGRTQSSDELDGVAARVRSGFVLEADAVSDSRVALTDNRSTADSASNAADNSLTATIGASAQSTGGPTTGPVMLLTPVASADTVGATFSILNRQDASNVVKARSGYLVDSVLDGGPAVRSTISGSVVGSAISSDGNSLDSAGKGNLAANTIELSGSIATTSSDGLAALVNRQALTGARVVATTHGGVGIDITGDLATSSVAASGNAFSAAASGNVATANTLTMTGAIVGGFPAVPASATSGGSQATLRLDNGQDYGRSGITAVPAGPAARVTIAGSVSGSELKIGDNLVTGRVTGNSAANRVAIAATTFDASAALANRQGGSGNIAVTIGQPTDRSGMTVATGGAITDSRLSVTGNAVTGAATGNVADNLLTATATSVSSSEAPAAVGASFDDYGARGALSLFNGQTIGGPDNANATPTIASIALVTTGIASTSPVSNSSLAVLDNVQRSAATANAAGNRVALDASDAGRAGLAVSSTQFGQANVTATSDMQLVTPTDFTGSMVSVSGNRNVAAAVVNDVDNAVSLTAATGSGNGPATATAGSLGSANGSADAALVNQQFASGSAAASAVSQLGNGILGSLDRSTLLITGNVTAADSAGNRALNSLTTSVASGSRSTALVNAQTNMARVDASAAIPRGASSLSTIDGSSVTIADNTGQAIARGNAADNALVVSGNIVASGADTLADRYGADARANASLATSQSNYGSVTTLAGDFVALNTGGVAGSTASISSNTLTASAFGNVAANSITTSRTSNSAGIALANQQVNYGPVTATVSGNGYQSTANALRSSIIAISGNQISALAVGNQASSAIAAPR